MQTREQIKNWKVVASVATVAALGVSGLAIASPGDPADTPPPIEIQDQRTTGDTFTTTTLGQFEVVPAPSFRLGEDSLDSPLASASLDSPVSADSSVDSPDTVAPATTAPAPTAPANDSPSSVDSPAPAPAADDSPVSVDSSVDSVDSLDS